MKKTKKGFTLVELLIVVAIMAIIAAVAVPTIMNASADSKKKTALTEMNNCMTQVTNVISGFEETPIAPADLVAKLNETYTGAKQIQDVYILKPTSDAAYKIFIVSVIDSKKGDTQVGTKYAIGKEFGDLSVTITDTKAIKFSRQADGKWGELAVGQTLPELTTKE